MPERAGTRTIRGAALVASVLLAVPAGLPAQEETLTVEVPPDVLRLDLPNGGGKSIAIPTAWGAAYGTVFLGGGFQQRAPFSEAPDAAATAGIGLWDPVRYVGVESAVTMLDVSAAEDFAASAKLHMYLDEGTSVAAGIENLFSPAVRGRPAAYWVVSHTVQGVAGRAPGTGGLHLSAGFGTGRFGEKSLRARRAGKGDDGTHVFGSVAVETLENLNLVGEWDGLGLNAGLSFTKVTAVGAALSLTAGLADLARHYSERPRLVASGSVGF